LTKNAFGRGIFCLHVTTETAGCLRVVFPDLYPYFRFEIYASDLKLPHHQNPFGKNLCLIGRATEFWHTYDTLASFLTERLAPMVEAGLSNDPNEVTEMEEHQAEPFSNYFTYHPGTAVIMDSGWDINTSCQSGTVRIGVTSLGTKDLKGIAFEVCDENGNTVAEFDNRLKRIFAGGVFTARWCRLSEGPQTLNPSIVFDHLYQQDPYPNRIESYPVDGGRLQIRAALFPEEVNNWRQLDWGWIFVCRFEQQETWQESRIKHTLPKRNRKKR